MNGYHAGTKVRIDYREDQGVFTVVGYDYDEQTVTLKDSAGATLVVGGEWIYRVREEDAK